MKWLKKVAATPLTSIARVIDSIDPITNERTNAPSIHAVREAVNSNWLSIYPIGSIYMSVNNVDPSTVFGGTWQQIKDCFLLACGDTYNNGETGGAANHTPSGAVGNHTLTVDEMPAHTHVVEGGTIPLPSGRYIATGWEEIGVESASPTTTDTRITNGSGGLDVEGTAKSTGGGLAHNHTFTGASADTMPPYLAVNVWVRTA